MVTHQELKQAIAVLETHRDILEDDVVNIAVAALQEKLLALQAPPPIDFEQNTTVLVADLSGFTAMSELMDAEEVRDTIQAIWQKLDGVIAAWGGKVDQHIGDGVVALFNIISDLEDCAERAVFAALDMQLELALLGQAEEQRNGGTGPLQRLQSDIDLRMRIGIHTGPVLLGKVGSSAQFTAVGDTIAIANQLEQAAPIGGVLVSDNVFHLIEHNFVTKTLSPLRLGEAGEQTPVHVVRQEKHHALQDVNRETSPGEARFVGRGDELERLQFALETTLESASVQVLMLLGETGVGKSRLRIEFEKLLALQPVPVHLFKGVAEGGLASAPYGVIRGMMANYFDIHRRSSPGVTRAKLVEGVASTLSHDDAHARERAHFIGYLLGFDFADSSYLQSFEDNPRRIREYAYQDMAAFFSAVTNDGPAVLLLENMHMADEGSLELLEYLAHTCPNRPLLIIYVACPSLLTRWPSCQLHLSITPQTHDRLDLPPLSPIDSRHLIANRLQNIPRPPLRLTDLLAEAAAGNPFLITELIEMLGEIGVIIKGSKQWRVQLGQLNDMRGRLTLDDLLSKQLERLTPLEQAILQKAAIIGDTFWETAVFELIQVTNSDIPAQQIQAALRSLEQQELIFRHTTSIFSGTVEYHFRHAPLRKAAYNAHPQSKRQASHAACAAWLQNQKDPHPPALPSAIALHLEKAGRPVDAANWYDVAANQARQNFTPETTIQYYRQALRLLPETIEHTSQRIQLNEGLGQTLRQQARFDEAIVIFTDMRNAALSAGDSAAAARAFRRLLLIQNFQGDYAAALATAQQAEEMAQANNTAPELAVALVAKGWATAYLGDLDQALALSKQALSLSSKAAARREMAYSYALMGIVHRILRRFDQARTITETALAIFREIEDRLWEGLMLSNLGSIAFARRDYRAANNYFEDSLQLARNIGDAYGAIRNLRELGRTAQQSGDFDKAAEYLRQTIIWAEKSGNVPFRINATADLGRYHLARQAVAETAVSQGEHLRRARLWLEQGQRLAEQTSQTLPRITLQIEMARLMLAEQTPAEALKQMQSALAAAHKAPIWEQGFPARKTCAIAWRELGHVAIELPPADLPIFINAQAYDIAACFKQSIQILSKLGDSARPEKARSVFSWAVYELRRGNHQRGESLWQEAQSIFTQLDMLEEVAKMERFAL